MLRKIFTAVVMVIALSLMAIGVYENMQGIYSAGGKSSALPELHYDITILRDGSSRVDEYRTYRFVKGPFSRGFLEVEGRIADVSVSEGGNHYEKMDSFSSQRPPGFYAVDGENTPARIEWYFSAVDGETRTFKVSYTVKDTVTLYDDCADYFQKYLSGSNVYKVKDFSAYVHLPEGANKNNTQIWAHGPVGGEVQFSGDTSVRLSMKNVPPGEFIEARFVMPREVLPGCERRVNGSMYRELVEGENTASAESDKEKRIINGVNLVSLMAALVLTVLPILLRIKYLKGLKRFTPQLAPDYYRELPSDIYPAELDLLMNHLSGREDIPRQITATLLDLIHKGVLKAENIETTGLFGGKRDTQLVLNCSGKTKLAGHEKLLLEFLFNEVGKGEKTITLSQIRTYCSNKKTAGSAYDFYKSFGQKVQDMARSRGYFETKRNELPRRIGYLIFLYILLMIAPMAIISRVDVLAGSLAYMLPVGSVAGFLVFTAFGPKKKNMFTQKGEDQFALWQAFKNFLSDFTAFDEKDLPELFMWEKYLVYATVLGVADRLLKQLFVRYPQLEDTKYLQSTSLMYAMNMRSFRDASASLDNMGQSIGSAMRSAVSMASRASRGSGGGFSSGGSSAGGGAGGSSGGVD